MVTGWIYSIREGRIMVGVWQQVGCGTVHREGMLIGWVWLQSGYNICHEVPNLANQNNRKLVVFDRKLVVSHSSLYCYFDRHYRIIKAIKLKLCPLYIELIMGQSSSP